MLKYDKMDTTAVVKLPNISPIIKMAMVSLILKVTARTAKSTRKLPRPAATTILHWLSRRLPKIPPNALAPKIRKATPKLAPLLKALQKGQ